MKLHFDEIFSHTENIIVPKFDIKNGEIFHKKGETFSDSNTIFGVCYTSLLSHYFELESLPGGGYEIKAYYVR